MLNWHFGVVFKWEASVQAVPHYCVTPGRSLILPEPQAAPLQVRRVWEDGPRSLHADSVPRTILDISQAFAHPVPTRVLRCKRNVLIYICIWGNQSSHKWLAQAQEPRCTRRHCPPQVVPTTPIGYAAWWRGWNATYVWLIWHLMLSNIRAVIMVEFHYLTNKDGIKNSPPGPDLTSCI